MISRLYSILGLSQQTAKAKQLPLALQLKPVPDTRSKWQRAGAFVSNTAGCLLFPVTLSIRATQFATQPVKSFFHETRAGRVATYALPALSIGTSMARSCSDYHEINQLRQDYTEQHDLSDDSIEDILSLPHIDRDNSIDRTLIVAIAEDIHHPSLVEQHIVALFTELYTKETRQQAFTEVMRVIDAAEISEDIKLHYKASALRHSQQADHPPAVTWSDSIRLIHEFGHETALVEKLIPLMFENVRTPQGSLAMTHVLLESFQLNNNLTPDQRTRYQHLVDEEFEKFQKRFGDNVAQTLSDKGLLDIESVHFVPVTQAGSKTEVYAPYTIDDEKLKLVTSVEEQLDLERAAFVDLMRTHQEWVLTKLPADSSEELRVMIGHRDDAFALAYPANFQDFASQLEQKEYFGSRIIQSYSFMTNEFERLNTGYIGAYISDMSAGSLGLSGFAGMIVGGWIFPEGGLAYTFYAGAGSAALFTPSNVSDTYYDHRSPLPFAMPGEGIMYDTPKEESFF